MKTLEYLKQFAGYLTAPNQDSLNLSLNNVHSDSLFSLVVNGTEFGKLKRIFIAGKKLKPYGVQLHTHRYPIKLTVLKGSVKQHTAVKSSLSDMNSVTLNKFTYKSFLNGGKGLESISEESYLIKEFTVPIGVSILMDTEEFHTISCAKGSIWIVEELGFDKESSFVLGVPFTSDNLYSKPEMFQINDKCQLVLGVLNQIIKSYENV